MKIIYKNEEGKEVSSPKFKSITKAKIFNLMDSKTLYYGNDEDLLDLTDFSEYGWKYIVTKEGENNIDILNYLNDDQKKLIGYNLNDIKNVRDILFPTLTNKHRSDKEQYFGSITIGDQKLILIKVDNKYDTLQLFDNISDKFPVITIIFEDREIYYNKLIWFVITFGDKISDINLAHISWINSKNPNRNIKNYLIKDNNEYINVCDNLKGTSEWLDFSSNTLLGNKEVINHPILSNIIDSLDDYLNTWNNYTNYYSGQEVIYNNDKWTSLINDNLNNCPSYSNSWVLSKSINLSINKGYINLKITNEISETNKNPAVVNPGFFTIPRGNVKKFEFIYNMGYVLDVNYLDTLNNCKINNILVNKYNLNTINYNIYKNDNKKFSLDYIFDKSSISKLNSLDIYFKKYKSNIQLESNNIDNIYSLVELFTNGEKITDNRIELGKTLTIKFKYSNLLQYTLSYIIEKRIVDNNIIDSSKIELIEKDNKKDYLEINRLIDVPASFKYEFVLTTEVYKILLKEYLGFYIDSSSKTASKNSIIEFKIIPIDNDLDTEVYLDLGNNNIKTLYPVPYNYDDYSNYIISGYYLGGNIPITLTRFSIYSDKLELLPYYVLTINKDIEGKSSQITNNIVLRLWK